MKKVKDYLFLIGVGGVVVALDQSTKTWVRGNLEIGEIWAPWDWIIPYARFVHWENTGAAFGMFPNGSTVFTIIAFVVIAAILYYNPMIPSDKWMYRLALGMQLGGAAGNLIDRLARGPVTDFISVGNFAVFNLADSGISVGVAILILAMWLDERSLAREEKCDDCPETSENTALTGQVE